MDTAKPVFVVGSPRSGTSILAWSLGYHPNIFPVPESNWMGDFAVNVAMSYQIGAARGIFSILSAMDISCDEFFSHIGRSINSLVLKHRCDLDRKRLIIAVQRLLRERGLYLGEVTGEFDAATSAAVQQYEMVDKTLYSELVDSLRTAASDSEYKTRWVDQTPEYSLHICGLRKLFPSALFIHIVRDVGSVVRSMLNFHRIAGTHARFAENVVQVLGGIASEGAPNHSDSICRALSDAAEIAVATCNRFSRPLLGTGNFTEKQMLGK